MDRLDHRFWCLAAAVCLFVEADAVRHRRENGTLSFTLRKVLHTDCVAGRYALRVGFVALGLWLVPHLERQAEALGEYLEDAAS